MLPQINIYLAKHAFMSERGEIYELLEANFAETGSRKVSTIRELFSSWATRESSRSNNIHLAHRIIVKRLDNGMAFSQAIAPFIPQEEALILEAAEASGDLVQGLQSVNAQRSATAEINMVVLAAMSEPAMGVAAICITAWFCGSSLWPELMKVVTEKYWADWTLPLIHFEIALAQHWQVSGTIFVFIFLYIWSIPRWTGRVRSMFDKVPPWSIYRDRQAANFLGVLGGLLAAGMELDAAMARIQKCASPWLNWHIHTMRRKLAVVGANPLTAMNTGLFSYKILDLIEDAARNKSFDSALAHLGSDALPMIVRRVKTMAMVTGTLCSVLTGMVFMYQVAVQQAGLTDATNRFMQSQIR
jgi:type II secretory pathway component PulF